MNNLCNIKFDMDTVKGRCIFDHCLTPISFIVETVVYQEVPGQNAQKMAALS